MIIIPLFGFSCYLLVSTIRAICDGDGDKAIIQMLGLTIGFALVTTFLATAFFPTNVENAISDKKMQLIEDIEWIDENVKSENREDMIKEKVRIYNDYLSSSIYKFIADITYYPFYHTTAKLTQVDIDSITMDNYIELILDSGKEIKK